MRGFAGLLLLCLLPASTLAEDSGDAARAIIERVEQLYRGESSSADITMLVISPRYQRELKMRSESLGKELAFFRILAPKKDRGIATLKRYREMWNYFPKINKVIKVPPSMMMGSWMGSDFTNDDLVKETELIDAYHLDLTETEAHYEVVLTPLEDTVTVWGKIDYVVAKEPLIPVSQTFYDDNGEAVRRMTFSEPKDFGGRMMPSVLEMIPLRKEGHATRVIYNDIQFDPADISEASFSMRKLKERF